MSFRAARIEERGDMPYEPGDVPSSEDDYASPLKVKNAKGGRPSSASASAAKQIAEQVPLHQLSGVRFHLDLSRHAQ